MTVDIRLTFAYTFIMSNSSLPSLSASSLRRELSVRNMRRAGSHPHEQSYSRVPNFIFQEHDGAHGNFHPESYQAIVDDPEWAIRLRKSYTGGQWIPRRWERTRSELDCANSSDALLMNIFCFPQVLDRPQVCCLLGIERGLRPQFGFKPRLPFAGQLGKPEKYDRTEVDMSLGSLLVEAKLTESGFQNAPLKRLNGYASLEVVFEVEELPRSATGFKSYQLIRGVLAAAYLERGFVVLCDGRRRDLVEAWFQIMRAVRQCDLRNRLSLLTWQELAAALPRALQLFLAEKYGIAGRELNLESKWDGCQRALPEIPTGRSESNRNKG
jgi:hypothetical protein